MKVITRSKPKWIIDLKSTAYTEPIGSGYEKAIIPYEPCNRPEKSKKDHVPKTTSKPKGLKNNGQPNPYNLRNRSEKDLSQNRSNKNLDITKPESLEKLTRPKGLEKEEIGKDLGMIEPDGSKKHGPNGPYNANAKSHKVCITRDPKRN